MANNGPDNPSGASPAKLVLVGVLGVILVVVLVTQFREGEQVQLQPRTNTPAIAPANRASRTPVRSAEPRQANPVSRAGKKRLHVTREDAERHDPFALPAVLAAAAFQAKSVPAEEPLAEKSMSREEALNRLQESGVSVVLIDGKQRLARIDGRDVKVGDRLDSFRVTKITADGVILVEQPE